MAVRGLDDQMRFALLPQGADYWNQLSTERMMGGNDANTLEVTGRQPRSLLADVQ